VKETIDLAIRITRERAHFIKTSTLMKLLESAHTRHRPPSKNGRQLKIRYATQGPAHNPFIAAAVTSSPGCLCACACACAVVRGSQGEGAVVHVLCERC